jgi:hypothetical protein
MTSGDEYGPAFSPVGAFFFVRHDGIHEDVYRVDADIFDSYQLAE